MFEIKNTPNESADDWISLSDVMSGLMLVFLFIALVFMRQERLQKDEIKLKKQAIEEIAIRYNERQDKLYERLLNEFGDSLSVWNAHITKPDTLSVVFRNPEVLFEAGKSDIRPQFESLLGHFWPRFVAVLADPDFKPYIEEIRIEGHTSSEWVNKGYWEAYFSNMRLSQERTRAVLQHVMKLRGNSTNLYWQQSLVTANGLSSSKLKKADNGTEDRVASRRVEFRVRTTAASEVRKIITKIVAD